jgi:anaerobic ribonucleoside-triphosphate reductase
MKITCDVCGKNKEGKVLEYENGEIRTRCNDCFKKNKSLKNYQDCEVYSRIVGYLRPVNQWNFGKQQEFKERKEYKNK